MPPGSSPSVPLAYYNTGLTSGMNSGTTYSSALSSGASSAQAIANQSVERLDHALDRCRPRRGCARADHAVPCSRIPVRVRRGRGPAELKGDHKVTAKKIVILVALLLAGVWVYKRIG